ncbi:MAG: methyl-accepting chemotaxis protein [Defluviitaleaceae bacterium]|nr:methyl-accepting chemotaxis protein [Defluviitaleaceae bacterium]
MNKSNDKLVLNSGKRRFRQSVSTRITIFSIALTLLFSIIIIIFSYFMYFNSSVTYHAQNVEAVAEAVAAFIDPDRFASSVNSPMPDAYWHILTNQMNSILNSIENLEFLYIILPYNETQFMYFNSAVRTGQPPNVSFREIEAPYIYGIEAFEALHEQRTTHTGIEDAGDWGRLISAFVPIIGSNGQVLGLVGADIGTDEIYAAVRSYVVFVSIISLSLALIVGIILRFRTIGAMRHSFRRILSNTHMTSSDRKIFHIRSEDKNSNEIAAKLYTSYADSYNSLNSLLDDIESVASAHLQGMRSVRIDDNKYSGAHKNLVNQVNEMLCYYDDGVKEIVDIMQGLGNGELGAQLEPFKGEWVHASDTINQMRTNIINVIKEIGTLADNAALGHFENEINISLLHGFWANIGKRLNTLIKAVDAPLAEIEENVILMSKGDFTLMGDTGFKGHFEVVRQACDLANVNIRAIIDDISGVLGKMAQGDLTVQLNDEIYIGEYTPIKEALTTILKSLNFTLSGIQAAADQVSIGAEQISGSASDIASGAAMQNNAIEKLSSSVKMIHEDAAQANAHATSANTSTSQSREFADRGTEAVGLMVDTMNRIKESSNSVQKIISTITNIAFQTNLLALNASVEAARAGDHGRGFSVVADEVRTLAGRSQLSASETEVIIQEDTKIADEGIKATNEVVNSFNLIASNISEIAGLIESITNISEKQLESISSINSSVAEISHVVSNTSSTSEESAAAAEELSSQADLLRQKVAFFKLR